MCGNLPITQKLFFIENAFSGFSLGNRLKIGVPTPCGDVIVPAKMPGYDLNLRFKKARKERPACRWGASQTGNEFHMKPDRNILFPHPACLAVVSRPSAVLLRSTGRLAAPKPVSWAKAGLSHSSHPCAEPLARRKTVFLPNEPICKNEIPNGINANLNISRQNNIQNEPISDYIKPKNETLSETPGASRLRHIN
jgi:hypothetical protein